MDETTIAKYRAEVIKKSINIEWYLNILISQRYLGYLDNDFIFEVLYDPYFSFSLKINIVSKLKDTNQEMIGKLKDIGRIRNIFAHYDPNFVQPSGEEVSLNPKNLEQQIDFQREFENFITHEKKVQNYLKQVLTTLGVKLESFSSWKLNG